MGTELLDRFPPVRRLGHQLHVGLIGQKSNNPLTENGMVVDYEDSNRVGIANHVVSPACLGRKRPSAKWMVVRKRSRLVCSARLQCQCQVGSTLRPPPP